MNELIRGRAREEELEVGVSQNKGINTQSRRELSAEHGMAETMRNTPFWKYLSVKSKDLLWFGKLRWWETQSFGGKS